MMTVTAGARVLTMAGDDLGTVKEVSGDRFKVNAPAQPDYWLGTDCIYEADDRTVRLRLFGDQIDDAKREGPERDGGDRRSVGDTIL